MPAFDAMNDAVLENYVEQAALSPYQRYIAISRYARYLPELNRRETWEETVSRYCNFFYDKNPEFPRKRMFDAIANLKVMPSMRALMTAGKALDRDNIAGYNCAYLAVDDPRAFDEAMFILLCGTGVGFSVERQSITKLPEIAEYFYNTDTVLKVRDSKRGWASAFRELISLLYSGNSPKWDLSSLRPAGAMLKTFGGRSSGPKPLDDLFKFTVSVFTKAAGRKLNSIECHDLMCKVGEVVVSGGVRRSALISLSNLSDDRIRKAKSGQWWVDEPQRALSNNSVVYTEKPDMLRFMNEWTSLYESKSGERGIVNRSAAQKKAKSLGTRRKSNYEFGTNPCAEITLRPSEFCNLSEVVIREDDTLTTLLEKVETATILGTFQATLTDFRYIRSIWRKNVEEERLLGVSLTGIMDHPVLAYATEETKSWLITMREHAVAVNKKWSDVLGIAPAAAITCTKPSGCMVPDTEIRTKDGVMTLERLFERNGYDINDYKDKKDVWLEPTVNTFVPDRNNEMQKVTKLYINGVAPTVTLTFEDGLKVRVTPNHKLLTANRSWIMAKDLTTEDDVVEFNVEAVKITA